MLKAIEAYMALRRATGFAMLNAECLLRSFAAFATERMRKLQLNGGAWTVGRSTRRPTEGRLSLRASCPG